MNHPRIGERIIARPTNPSVPVQRGESLFGQFLAPGGQEVLWDDFLHRRLMEGAIVWEPIPQSPLLADEPSAEKEAG